MRPSNRAPDEMRAITIETGFTKHAEGSCLISFGDTRVLCTASIEERIPPWLRGKGEGWVTGEYSMLPRATHTRGSREAARGKQSGRTQEIQRLIGRSLRAVVDLKKLGERQITLDCDVIQAVTLFVPFGPHHGQYCRFWKSGSPQYRPVRAMRCSMPVSARTLSAATRWKTS